MVSQKKYNFYYLCFHLEIILSLEENCKNSTKSPHMPFIQYHQLLVSCSISITIFPASVSLFSSFSLYRDIKFFLSHLSYTHCITIPLYTSVCISWEQSHSWNNHNIMINFRKSNIDTFIWSTIYIPILPSDPIMSFAKHFFSFCTGFSVRSYTVFGWEI